MRAIPGRAVRHVHLGVLASLIVIGGLRADVAVREAEGAVTVSVSGRPVLVYNETTVKPPRGMDEVYARSGFIHPLYSPSGKVLTDPFPVGHVHQHGVFSAWTRATFRHKVVDFWNQAERLGNVEQVATTLLGTAAFKTELQQVSTGQGPAIVEEWTVTAQDSATPYIVDIDVRQRCATNDEVYLHPYHYGGFGIRGSAHWNAADRANFEGAMKVLTSEGVGDVEKSNHTRPRWIAAYGPVEGVTAGFALMVHPASFRAPQPVRVHATMPYFVYSPVVAGSFVLQPGREYTARYRLVTFDGEPDRELLEKLYQAFAARP